MLLLGPGIEHGWVRVRVRVRVRVTLTHIQTSPYAPRQEDAEPNDGGKLAAHVEHLMGKKVRTVVFLLFLTTTD